jgi:hypothetical protein
MLTHDSANAAARFSERLLPCFLRPAESRIEPGTVIVHLWPSPDGTMKVTRDLTAYLGLALARKKPVGCVAT